MDAEEHTTRENEVISFDELNNILSDFRVMEFTHARTSLLVTATMRTLHNELNLAILRQQNYVTLLEGPSGVGKTTTLLYIGHVAREKGYVVFHVTFKGNQ